jgi:hypothetical protein
VQNDIARISTFYRINEKKNSQPKGEFFFTFFRRKVTRNVPINYQHQVNLLKDILNNHQTDCCGSIAECEQLERLVKSLMVNSDIHDNVKSVLQEIYTYSQAGVHTGNLDDHITTNQAHLAEWVNNIDQYS